MRRSVAVVLMGSLLLGGCTAFPGEQSSTGESRISETAAEEPAGPISYRCETYEVTAEMLADPRLFAELDEHLADWYRGPATVLASTEDCAVLLEHGQRTLLTVGLDASLALTVDSTVLHLLVQDQRCGGNTDLPERIDVLILEQREDVIAVLLGARPLPPGAYYCVGHPPMSYTVMLDAPLGDRAVVDLSRPLEQEDSLRQDQ